MAELKMVYENDAPLDALKGKTVAATIGKRSEDRERSMRQRYDLLSFVDRSQAVS